tara:strand:- start:16 stop:183 length:168 start_codon:yes stop_codon:yes gene_type:complete
MTAEIKHLKKEMKKIGELTLPLCRNENTLTRETAIKVNSIAHECYLFMERKLHSK